MNAQAQQQLAVGLPSGACHTFSAFSDFPTANGNLQKQCLFLYRRRRRFCCTVVSCRYILNLQFKYKHKVKALFSCVIMMMIVALVSVVLSTLLEGILALDQSKKKFAFISHQTVK